MILVMLRPTVAPPRDTECVDVPGGPQTETFFAKDLPDAVPDHYRVGSEAAELGHHRRLDGRLLRAEDGHAPPAVYAAGAGLSADYKAPVDPTTGDLFQATSSCGSGRTPAVASEHLPRAGRLCWSPAASRARRTTGHAKFIEPVKGRADAVSSIILDSGGHNFNTWRREIPPTLVWMSSNHLQA